MIGFLVFYTETAFETVTLSSSALAIIFKLKKMGTETKNLPYKKAILNDSGGDPAGRWSISFWVWHAQKKDTVRRFDYAINKEVGKTPEETVAKRRVYAKARIKAINQLLEDGYHISNKVDEKSIDLTVRKGMEKVLVISGSKGGSYNSYSSTMNIFLNWAEINGYDSIQLDEFKQEFAYEYIDWRVSSGKKGTTINNDVSYIRRLFSILKKREFIQKNPFF